MTPGYLRHRAQIIGMLDDRRWPYWWVENEISEGRITLLESETAVIGVEKKSYPGGLVELHGMFAAGELDGILELIDHAVEAARLQGCDAAAISSRPAWVRLLKSRGFEPHQQTIVKDLRNGAF